jgi:hypothetical protein
MRRATPIIAVVFFSVSAAVQAATVSFSDSIPVQPTNFSSSVSVSKFDPSLGTLLSIQFDLAGAVEGSARFESLDAAPATVTMNLSAQIALQRPDNSTLVVVLPLVQTVDNVTAFDGTIDFGGTSGRTYSGLSNSASNSFTSPPPISDLALFTGLGNITLPVVATGMSSGSGAGNLILQFNTSAGADVMVTYTYEPIPEPASLALLGFGMLTVLRRRRR